MFNQTTTTPITITPIIILVLILFAILLCHRRKENYIDTHLFEPKYLMDEMTEKEKWWNETHRKKFYYNEY